MKRSLLLCLIVVSVCGSAVAQPVVRLFAPSKSGQVSTLVAERGAAFSVDPSALARAYDSPHFIATDIALPASGSAKAVSIDVAEFSVFGPETHFLEQNGNSITELPLPEIKLYRGTVVGEPGSFAYLAITRSGKVSGRIRSGGEEYSIGYPKGQVFNSVITAASSIHNASDRTRCELTNEAAYDMKRSQLYLAERGAGKNARPQSVQTATKTAIVAFDADYECYQSYGGSQEVQDYLVSIMGAITSVYETEVDMAMQIGTVKIWTSADPYSGSDLNSLLSSFTNTWNTVGSNSSISRTMTHLMDNKLGSGSGAQGLAWVDVMCDPDHGFGVTNVTGNTSLPIIDEEVMAHELGHNVGSYHTHNCVAYPPNGIDHCVANDGGGSCSWTPVQTKGTIMSYCNQKDFTFGQRVQDTLKVRIDAAPCLESLAQIQVKADSVNFPNTQLSTKRDTLLKDIVKSTGSVPLKILGVQFVPLDGNDSEWTLKNAPKFPLTVASGSTQSFTVTYRPLSTGPNYGMMIIYHNAQGGSDTVYLNGTGTQQHAFYATTSVDFGIISDGNRHDTTVALVGNDGDAPLTIKKVVLSGTNAPMFTVTQPSKNYVNPGDTLSLALSFTAASDGVKTANVDITTDDPIESILSVQLSANVDGLGVVNTPLPSGVDLTISPNPSVGQLSVSLNGMSKYIGQGLTATLYDKLGKAVATMFAGSITSSDLSFSWQKPASLSNGSYVLVLQSRSMKIGRSVIFE
ncbi:MAG: choice-of-anchor D domain-containing protein [Bacteroidetes bacterium]|nr:choice-of-anchor D domain-containing protein [Bacteroidota bacterium]